MISIGTCQICENHTYGEASLSYSWPHMFFSKLSISVSLSLLCLLMNCCGEDSDFCCSAPIIVYMYDKDSGGLISIAEYGDEYGKENPIRVLYHGFGHYDALQIPATASKGVRRSKL